MVEYYARRAVMMVDYKHNVARSSVDENFASHQALAWLADGKSIPFVTCIYNLDIEEPLFEVLPVNQTAKDYFGGPHILTEESWVRYQHHLRGLAQNKELERVLESLKNEAPRTENRGPRTFPTRPSGRKKMPENVP